MANGSIVDYLKESGQDSSLSSRAKLATQYGFAGSEQEYLNLAGQGKNADINTRLLGALQSKTPAPNTPAGGSSEAVNAAKYNNSTVTSSQIEQGSNLPEPTTYANTEATTPFSDRVSSVAKSTLTSSQLEIDKLRKELQDMTTTDKAAAQKRQDNAVAGIQDYVGSTDAQDALEANNKKFKVEQNIKLYSDIQTKLVDAQQALEVGLIYEKDRPARMKFITGAESTLMKQGLATIGALQGTAAVIKGNLDLARAFGDSTIAAIKQDNEQSFKALTTLLDLATNDLINLDAREKEIIDQRLSAIESENTRVQSNKDDVVDLMTQYPRAFLAGGVTLLDSKEEALRKMLPQMAADETALFNASTATGTSTVSDKDGPSADKQHMLQLKANGLTYEEAVDAFSDTLSVSWIQAVYGKGGSDTSNQDKVIENYYGQFLNPDGSMKEGYSVLVDPSKGDPSVTKTKAEGDSKWWNPRNWF